MFLVRATCAKQAFNWPMRWIVLNLLTAIFKTLCGIDHGPPFTTTKKVSVLRTILVHGSRRNGP
ncbi:MAG TPA: hypothetical protein VMF91_06950 [Bryobacteraceae bacterium]|nr:hypothetical protein [Bryobacteraceae bacterium]